MYPIMILSIFFSISSSSANQRLVNPYTLNCGGPVCALGEVALEHSSSVSNTLIWILKKAVKLSVNDEIW